MLWSFLEQCGGAALFFWALRQWPHLSWTIFFPVCLLLFLKQFELLCSRRFRWNDIKLCRHTNILLLLKNKIAEVGLPIFKMSFERVKRYIFKSNGKKSRSLQKRLLSNWTMTVRFLFWMMQSISDHLIKWWSYNQEKDSLKTYCNSSNLLLFVYL